MPLDPKDSGWKQAAKPVNADEQEAKDIFEEIKDEYNFIKGDMAHRVFDTAIDSAAKLAKLCAKLEKQLTKLVKNNPDY